LNQYNGVTLAYIGDAYYELLIREALLSRGLVKVENLHNEAVSYTSAEGQKRALDAIFSDLTEEEVSYFKRGRNQNTNRKARNADLATYKQATGFEALLGHLYLSKQFSRIEELLNKILAMKKAKNSLN